MFQTHVSQAEHDRTGSRPETRERVLDAAERLFAERGFRATSIRDITAAARCNVAAVNYHFGGKVGLYREMFRRRLAALREQRVASIRSAMSEAGDRADLELVLRAFTRAFLEPHEEQSAGRGLVRLFSRELLDPHLRPGTLHREMVRPVEAVLTKAITSVHPVYDARAVRRCIHSLVAQLVHVVQMRNLPGVRRGPDRNDFAFPGVVNHVVRFSAEGIRACLGRSGAVRPGARRFRRLA